VPEVYSMLMANSKTVNCAAANHLVPINSHLTGQLLLKFLTLKPKIAIKIDETWMTAKWLISGGYCWKLHF